MRAQKKGGKLSEFREKRNEFLTPPLTDVLRGEPKAKLLGDFSLVRFFGANKEMNILLLYAAMKNDECNATDGHFRAVWS